MSKKECCDKLEKGIRANKSTIEAMADRKVEMKQWIKEEVIN